MLRMKKKTKILVFSMFLQCAFCGFSQNVPFSPSNLTPYGVTIKTEVFKGKQSLLLEQAKATDSNQKYTFARLNNLDFHNGTIELSIAGELNKNPVEGARGFVGIAFRVKEDTSKYEIFYIRPTNGRAEDQVRRNHATQYISYPNFPWQKLRKEFPEKYEAYADLQAGEWTKIKIEVEDQLSKLYVNGASQPTLIVNDLKQGKDLRGSIGLWLDISTIAHFTGLKVTKKD